MKANIIELYDTQQKDTYIYCNEKFNSKEEFEIGKNKKSIKF